METNRLRQFCTVVETGNLRRAAEILGISHSGLSKSIKTLEEELGFALFLPSGRGIVVSDPGRELYQRTAKFFDELSKLIGQSEIKEEGLLRLGSFEVFTTYFTGKLLKKYLPNTAVEIHDLIPGKLEEALSLNRVDLGITYEPIPRPKIEYVKITRILMGAYAIKGRFDDQKLEEVPFVVPVSPLDGTPSGVKGSDAWPENRFERKAAYKVDLLATGLELTRLGLCAIFIPQFVARLHNEGAPTKFHLHALPLPKSMPQVHRDVYIVKRESTAENDTIKKVAKAIREICA